MAVHSVLTGPRALITCQNAVKLTLIPPLILSTPRLCYQVPAKSAIVKKCTLQVVPGRCMSFPCRPCLITSLRTEYEGINNGRPPSECSALGKQDCLLLTNALQRVWIIVKGKTFATHILIFMKAILSFNFLRELCNCRGLFALIGGNQTSVAGYDGLISVLWFSAPYFAA